MGEVGAKLLPNQKKNIYIYILYYIILKESKVKFMGGLKIKQKLPTLRNHNYRK